MKIIYGITFLLIYLEIIFKAIVLKKIDLTDTLYTIFFSVQVILIINLICTIFKEKISKTIYIVISLILTIYYGFQTVFFKLFSIPFSFSTIGLAKGALGFTDIVLSIIFDNIGIILILFVPFILGLIFIRKIKVEEYSKKKIIISILLSAVLVMLTPCMMYLDRSGSYSAYNLYFEIDAQEKNIEKFGLLEATLIDINRTIFGFEEKIIVEIDNNNVQNTNTNTIEENEEKPKEITYNKLDLNLEELQNSNDNNLRNIGDYIQNIQPTNKNEYTGYFKDKNLIFILAEGFNSIAINKELTPTLYKLSNSGFVFNNFYSPVFLSTTGGEFQATTGLIPTQTILNLWKSEMPTIKYALGNSFSKYGYKANAYHNWTYNYYSREKTMKTLGFNSYMGIGNGLEKLIDRGWLPRDVDMINETTKFYTNEDKFVTYYITVSGHAPYNFGGGNSTATRYKDLVEDLPYNTSVKAYLASQIELDRALEALIEKLKEAGILEDTVIALVGDHYPYTLDINQINSISDYKRDDIVEVNRSNFILWNSEISKPIYIDKVGSQIDVLPTLLNLFGIEYDSRLMVGKDILSDNDGLGIFSNRSWVSDYGTYFSKENKFVVKEGKIIPEGYVESINSIVTNKFTMSNIFIKYDIYNKIIK